MFGFGFYDVLIIAGFLGIQQLLSTRDSVYWGGVIPVIFITWRTWIFFNENEGFLSYMLITLLGMAFLIGGWHRGRKTFHSQRNKELERMASHDIR